VANSKQRRQTRRSTINAQQTPVQNSSETLGQKETPSQVQQRMAKQKEDPKPQKLALRIVKWLGVPTTIFGVIAALSSFFPHLILSEPTVLDETQFFSKSMTVTNDGLLPVYSVYCALGFGELKTIQNGKPINVQGLPNRGTHIYFNGNHPVNLLPGDAYTFALDEAMKADSASVVGADFDVVISYVPIFPPLRMERCTHFVLRVDSSGKQHWFRSPGQCAIFRWL
jgi:hypothetical protein